ncbi:MAG: hypothetical protein KGM24_07550 [Elusimicrobia bacterium]|nr:hypothetical protein [Elusimicrobiota bacterium]
MRRIRSALTAAGVVVLLAGCVAASRSKFSFDFKTGELRRTYCGLSSVKDGGDKDYSAAKDWDRLKGLAESKKPEYDPDVVAEVSKTLFEKDGELCGRRVQKVLCPKCFPSKAAVLSYLHDKTWRFELFNGAVVAFVPSGKTILSTNGQKAATPGGAMIVWPRDAETFEYEASDASPGGTSLLPFYLKDRGAK